MKKLKLFVISSTIIAILIYGFWLNSQIIPGVAWQNKFETPHDGWDAILKAWPIYTTSGLVTGVIGIFVGISIGGTPRELYAEAEAKRIKNEYGDLKDQTLTEQRELVSAQALAAHAKESADSMNESLHQKVAEQSAIIADLESRLKTSVKISDERKEKRNKLKKDLKKYSPKKFKKLEEDRDYYKKEMAKARETQLNQEAEISQLKKRR